MSFRLDPLTPADVPRKSLVAADFQEMRRLWYAFAVNCARVADGATGAQEIVNAMAATVCRAFDDVDDERRQS